MNRRNWFALSGTAALATALPFNISAKESKKKKTQFKFCLNTSTIMGKKAGIEKYIEVAARAGFDAAEIWMMDIDTLLSSGKSLSSLSGKIKDAGITIENAIGFAPWMVPDESTRKKGYEQLKKEMGQLAELGCSRIAAPPAGLEPGKVPPLETIAEYYAEILEIGRQTGVMPQLEFWGASGTIFNLGQVMHIAAATNDADVRLLPDIYHLYRGGSGFEALNLLSGSAIEVFHFNDYPKNKPREEQNDADRVFPGDGNAPMSTVVNILKNMGGTKVLSLELFNRDYWQQDELTVAKTGLQKMKKVVNG